jgi:hypothetical protein
MNENVSEFVGFNIIPKEDTGFRFETMNLEIFEQES